MIFTQHKETIKNNLLHIKDRKFYKKKTYDIQHSFNKKIYNNCICFFLNCVLIFCLLLFTFNQIL